MNVIFLWFNVALLLCFNCDALETEGIVGGEDVVANQCSYQVSIQINGKHVCGGGIVDENFILTAAHCVTNKKGRFYKLPMKIVAGVNDINDESDESRVVVDVREVYIPSEYDPIHQMYRTIGDIALLQVNEPLNIESASNLMKLELPKNYSYADEDAIITGFGWDSVRIDFDPINGLMEKGDSFGRMRLAETKVINQNICNNEYFLSVTDKHMCARVIQHNVERPEGVCSGDSGSPLVYNDNTVIGVLSTSPIGCREDASAAVYTRVSSYLDFIRKVLHGESNFDFDIRSTILKIRS